MPEKNFGETTEFFGKTLFERINDEMKEQGFEFAGIESLTIWQMDKDSVFEEVPIQTLSEIREKYEKLPGVQEVKIITNPENPNLVWVFLKSK